MFPVDAYFGVVVKLDIDNDDLNDLRRRAVGGGFRNDLLDVIDGIGDDDSVVNGIHRDVSVGGHEAVHDRFKAGGLEELERYGLDANGWSLCDDCGIRRVGFGAADPLDEVALDFDDGADDLEGVFLADVLQHGVVGTALAVR